MRNLKKQWQNNGFNYGQTKTWIKDSGLLKPREYDFAWWLVKKQIKSPEQLNSDEVGILREQLKQEWKEVSSDWNIEIQAEITKWIRKGFAAQETKKWLESGLTLKENDIAVRLKQKGHNPSETNVREVIKKERENNIDAQQWLEQNYPLEQRVNIKKLNIGKENLVGPLKLAEFNNLEEFYCYGNKLTSLDCSNCPQLKIVRCQINNLTNLNLTNCSNINELYCNRNNLTDLDFLQGLSSEKLETLLVANNNFFASDSTLFARFINLKNLGLGNWFQETIEQNIYNRFSGSLKPLEKLTKLEELDIAGTDIDHGLEYLPNNLQVFYCSTTESPASKAELMAEELRKYGETEKDDDGDENFASPLQTWREFINSSVQEWLNKNYPMEERSEIAYLDISKKNLVGTLKLEKFTSLVTLNCSNNQLTNLNLSDCSNLANLDCSNNKLHDLYFLKSLNKLESLVMKNNQVFAQRSLKCLALLTNLEELNISDCPLEGSLKPLANLSKLETLRISNTNVEEGLEYLPTSCRKLYCNTDYPHKSVKIIKELDKSKNKCSDEKNGVRYYNLDRWREDRADNLISLVVPLERLFVTRSNIKKFINKWGIEEKLEENNRNWYSDYLDYYIKITKPQEDSLSQLTNLQSPEQFNKHWYWVIPQWGGRGAIGASGVLSSVYGYQIGGVAIASPVIETITSYAKKHWYETKQKQWEEFTQDAKELLDSYHELKGIIENIQAPFLIGKVNKSLTNLKDKIRVFLKEYDKDSNEVIDIFELQKGKEKLARDLDKEGKWIGGSQLGRIAQAMKKLEEEIINYRQEKSSEEISLDDKRQELAWIIIDRLEEYSNSLEFDAEKEYNYKGREDNHWQGKKTWKDYLEMVTKKDNFTCVQENLLYPLVELIIEKLAHTNVEELLKDHEKNSKLLEEKFVKQVKDLCDICQELKSEELDKFIVPLKNKVADFSEYLEKSKINDSNEESTIIIEEESKLTKIFESMKTLEEQVKICYDMLTDKGTREENSSEGNIQQEENINQALIEIPLDN